MNKKKRKRVRGKRSRKQPNNQLDNQPDLRFGPGDLSGFTAAGVSGFEDINPAAVIRELLQNSLDAAREARRDLTIVRFEVETHDLNSIPGIESYRSAFERAVEDQKKLLGGNLQDKATGIVHAMRECLKSKECATLFVLDNGIGLDEDRMKGLLADGLSIKDNQSTGAVGNGHLTVIPASDMRYVLYGGRTENGEIIGSGHAILASHQQGGIPRSKDGFYVKELKPELFKLYIFPENSEVSPYIKTKLDWIADKWEPGAGTVVAVPGFNWFREREDENSLWDMISKAAACNFFPAFIKGELRIELKESGIEKALDKSNFASTLEQFSTEKRTHGGFLSGSRALAAFETIKNGDDIRVDTDIGCISMRWLPLPQGGLSRVELCRNGMWITGDLPKLQRNRFANFKPFHCVILLDASDGKIHELIRKAEGPLHNDVKVKKLVLNQEKAALYKALEAVFSKLKEVVPTQDNQEFEIEDFLAINSNGLSSGGRRPGMAGQFQEVRRRPRFPKVTDEGEDTEVGPGSGDIPEKKGKGGGVNTNRRGRGTFRRSGNAIRFGALPIPTGRRAYRVDLRPDGKAAASEVRFALDESLDESCDAFGSEAFVRLKNVKIDSRPVFANKLTCDEEGHALGVRLGTLDPEKPIRIEFDYELPSGVNLSNDMPVVLKTQLIRRAAGHKNQETS
ncbi:MAG: hypothetical protein J4F48_07475 [Nitrospinae bacterium]|nr:hypothetical protein [Nitrospinota bacterium]